MSLKDGIISAPVSIDDVKSVLGESSNDLATLCKSDNIDKWAEHKPVVYKANFDSNDGKGNGNYGLSPVIVEGDSSYTNDTTAMSNIIQAILKGNDDWVYAHPTGGANSPYRLGDFVGYKNKNYPPFYMNYDKEVSVNVQVTPTYMWGITEGEDLLYSKFSLFDNNDLYLWGFYSKYPNFKSFNYFRSDSPIAEGARVGTQITVGLGRKYFVFAMGNAKGNKFLTIPNSYGKAKLTSYPLSAVFYRSFFEEDLSLVTADCKDQISVGYGTYSLYTLLELEEEYGDGLHLILAVNRYRDFYITFYGTPLTNSSYELTDVKLSYEGSDYNLSDLKIDQNPAGSLSLIKGKSQYFSFHFKNVFSDYDATTNQPKQLDIQLKIKGNTIINLYGTKLYSIGGKAINEDGFVPYKYNQY